MTLDPGTGGGQGAQPAGVGEQVDSYLMNRLLPVRGAVNCDIMARRLSRRRLLALADVLDEGAELIRRLLGEEPRDSTSEQHRPAD